MAKAKQYNPNKYDAKSEETFCDSVPTKIEYGFQANTYKWTYSESHSRENIEVKKEYQKQYTPDINFKLFDLELKGYFRPDAKRRMEAFKKMYPEVDLRIAFQDNKKISPKSKRRYLDWARIKGFKACIALTYDDLPEEWKVELNETDKS